MIEKNISGGQTGVDRAALDAAMSLNVDHGGWCPKGRLAEDGKIPLQYALQETETAEYSERTKFNIRDSDGTLVLVPMLPIDVKDGTVLTVEEVKKQKKPHLIIDLSKQHDFDMILNWATENDIKILNIAGPRESSSPGIYQASFKFCTNVLSNFSFRPLTTNAMK